MTRRDWMTYTAGLAWAGLGHAADRRFDPQPSAWRGFELTTRIELARAEGGSQVWLPVPSIESSWQRSGENRWTTNAVEAAIVTSDANGVRMLHARFAPGSVPVVELVSRFETRNRVADAAQRGKADADVARWKQPTALMPTDGVVARTVARIVDASDSDLVKVRKIYDWMVANTYREPSVRGCGDGNVKAMLETGNFGGKCADLNAMFVCLCRGAGVAARDVYGIRIEPSAFGYRELGASSSKLQGAQHCRAEVFLQDAGWVAMDPADVGKVMRQETSDWIRDAGHPLVAPVRKALFGSWEGNWVGFNSAHDVVLPGSADRTPLPFLMYPQAEDAAGRCDALDADAFRYTISARRVDA
ncbi:transglutaminase family protein [Schlegelella sp. ID0723]|uniref:Transglutaminase family protein n=1 Tax=Piscinibacter koreensis TaxID=2742824 RepID=A0A7Y6NL13_9BURK|nr:transglutaminase family protein [Schlegelella koreensis]